MSGCVCVKVCVKGAGTGSGVGGCGVVWCGVLVSDRVWGSVGVIQYAI